jgi:hypothetical protein
MKPIDPIPGEAPGWFNRKENVRKVLAGLYSACGLLVLTDIVFALIHFDKHPHFRWEEWPAFYAVYGFVACVILVLISKYILRPAVMRDENYYNKVTTPGEDQSDH